MRIALLSVPLLALTLAGCSPDPLHHDDATIALSGTMGGDGYEVLPGARIESYPASSETYLMLTVKRTSEKGSHSQTPMLSVEVNAGDLTTICTTFRSYIWSGYEGSTSALTLECDGYIPDAHETSGISAIVE